MTNARERQYQTLQIVWSGITLSIRYEPHWLNGKTLPHVAHIEIRAMAPEREPLPTTETGYKSHFCDRREIEAAGGPVAYVLAWLDMAAESKTWREARIARRQLSLFDSLRCYV